MLSFFKPKVVCVFCKKKTKTKTAYTIKMNMQDGKHVSYACPPCAAEFDELAQYVEKDNANRSFTL